MKFDFLEPSTLTEAVSLLARYGSGAKVIAGGTDIIVRIKDKAIRPAYLVSLARIAGLDQISGNGAGVRIGAMATASSLEKSAIIRAHCPIISEAAGQLASGGIRNVATVGGNLCNASPSADTAPALIAAHARAHLIGPDADRELPLEEFFAGPGKSVLGQAELMESLTIPAMPPRTGGVYMKYGMRGSTDLAIVGVAAVVTLDGNNTCRSTRVVLGAVAPTPMRAIEAEDFLKGKIIGEAEIAVAARLAAAAARPISDVRASAEYRRDMVAVFTRRALHEALRRAKEVGGMV